MLWMMSSDNDSDDAHTQYEPSMEHCLCGCSGRHLGIMVRSCPPCHGGWLRLPAGLSGVVVGFDVAITLNVGVIHDFASSLMDYTAFLYGMHRRP